MGVLNDFIIAFPAEAQRVGDSPNPLKEFSGVNANGIDQVKLGTLYAILIEAPYDLEFMTDEASLLYIASDDGPWVQAIPQDMVYRLAQLGIRDLPDLAAAWAQTEDFDPAYSNWTSTTVVWFLRALVVLARKAVTEDKALLMRTCL